MKYRKGYKYQLAEDYQIQTSITGFTINSDFVSLDSSGVLLIKKGYAWDGPSGPTIDTKTFMRGSLVHDVLYQLIREEKLPPKYRLYADYLIWKICREDGMCRLRAWYVYTMLKKYASFAADPSNKRPVQIAP